MFRRPKLGAALAVVLVLFVLRCDAQSVDFYFPKTGDVVYMYLPMCVRFDFQGDPSTTSGTWQLVVNSNALSLGSFSIASGSTIDHELDSIFGILPGDAFLQLDTDAGECFRSPTFSLRVDAVGPALVPACVNIPIIPSPEASISCAPVPAPCAPNLLFWTIPEQIGNIRSRYNNFISGYLSQASGTVTDISGNLPGGLTTADYGIIFIQAWSNTLLSPTNIANIQSYFASGGGVLIDSDGCCTTAPFVLDQILTALGSDISTTNNQACVCANAAVDTSFCLFQNLPLGNSVLAGCNRSIDPGTNGQVVITDPNVGPIGILDLSTERLLATTDSDIYGGCGTTAQEGFQLGANFADCFCAV